MPAALACPACHKPRAARQYLCRGCWYTLPAATRQELSKGDKHAFARLRHLHDQIAAGTPLANIHIPPTTPPATEA